jgi:hypothetical protein
VAQGQQHFDRLCHLLDREFRVILRKREVEVVEDGHERARHLHKSACASSRFVLNRSTLEVREVCLRAQLCSDRFIALSDQLLDNLREVITSVDASIVSQIGFVEIFVSHDTPRDFFSVNCRRD